MKFSQLSVLAASAAFSVNALDPARDLSQYSIRHYLEEQGLPQSSVQAIAQTPDGYMWFGTQDGLARFDGVRFTVFRHETTPELPHSIIAALLVDRSGTLWCGTTKGLAAYRDGKFKPFGTRDGLPDAAVRSLFEDRQGNLWIATWKGLAKRGPSSLRVYTTADGLPSDMASGLAGDGADGLWVGTNGGGISHFVNGAFQTFTTRDGLPSDFIREVLRDKKGELWVGTTGGLARLSGSRFQPVAGIKGESVMGLFEDKDENIWVGTNRFLARLTVTSAFSVFTHNDALPGDSVWAIFEDREGSLWVGMNSAGVARYRDGPFTTFTTRQGLAHDRSQSFFEDSRGNLWLATFDGLSRLSNGRIERVAGAAELGDGFVRSVTQTPDGTIWAGTAKGLARYDGHSWKQMGARDGLNVDNILALYCDRAGRLWIGSPHGLAIWDHGRVSTIEKRDGLPNNVVHSILEDHAGRFWIGTVGGLARIDGKEIKVFHKADGLLTDNIYGLYEDAENVLWVCTIAGFHRIKDGRIQGFTSKDGLFTDDSIYVVEDDSRRLWISSKRGVYRIDKDALSASGDKSAPIESTAYGTDDGMKSAECRGEGLQAAAWRTRDGRLWFPTARGVVMVQPRNLRPLPALPPVLLESVLVDGQGGTAASYGPGVRRIEFHYTTTSFIAPEQIEFRHRLDGFGETWSEATQDRTATYTNLGPGRYRLLVAQRKKGRNWSPDAASVMTFEIVPHFYQTRWFLIACLTLLAGCVWLAHSFRLRRVEERFATIMAERTRVAQELHDTLLQGFSGAAMQVEASLSRFRQGSVDEGCKRLSTGLAQMGQCLADARQSIWDLQPPELEGKQIHESLEAACAKVCADGPRLQFDLSGEPRAIEARVEKQIYRIGLEAVSNAVRHAAASQITVALAYEPERTSLLVRDDGTGFEIDGAEIAAMNHWGMKGMRLRARESGGRLVIHSAPGAGTSVLFEIDVNASTYPNG